MEIEDIPGNSRARRPPMNVPTPTPEPEKEKHLEQITTGEVKRRKQPLGKRIREVMVGGDAQSVGGYVLFDVLVPALKDTIADMVSQGIERMLFGEARSSSRRTGFRPSSSSPTIGHVSYNKVSAIPPWRREDPRPTISRQARATHDFRQLILATRREGEAVISRMYDLIEQYDQVTVADLYELVGETGDFTDHKYGWTRESFEGCQVRRDREGYLLDLPRPEPL